MGINYMSSLEEFQRLRRENIATYTPARFGGDIGLAYLNALDEADALELLAKRRVVLAEALQAAQTALNHEGSLQLVIEHQARLLAAELEWLDEVISRLQRKQTRK